MSNDPIRPILCRSLVVDEPIPGDFGGVIGYRRKMPAASLTIRLRPGRVEHLVGPDNRVIAKEIPGVHVRFVNGTLEVSGQTIRETGMTREEVVAILRAEATRGGYEVLSETGEERDARRPGVPAGAGK